MCLFKKRKKIEPVKGKYDLTTFVYFRHRDELHFGYIYKIYKDDKGIIYDIQIGGQCPAVVVGVREEVIFVK